MPRATRRHIALVASLLFISHYCAALLDVQREASALAAGAVARPVLLSPLDGSTIAHNGSLHIRVVVPAMARAVCSRALVLSLFLDDIAIASQPLPPPGAEPFHAAFVLEVEAMQLQPGGHELLVQFADGDGDLLGSAAAVEVHVKGPRQEVSPSHTTPSQTPLLSHINDDEHAFCPPRAASSWICRDDSSCNSAGSCVLGVCRCRPGWCATLPLTRAPLFGINKMAPPGTERAAV
jgi:hypothetical protein